MKPGAIYYDADAQRATSTVQSSGPLPTLSQQLERVTAVRVRISQLTERLIGPRPAFAENAKAPQTYGGVVGALEGEAVMLRQNVNEMLTDLDAIEEALR